MQMKEETTTTSTETMTNKQIKIEQNNKMHTAITSNKMILCILD